jgi:DNA ligase D-like protein (predicted ligase)
MANAMPEWVVPMAATLTQDRFESPDWIFEQKFDGIRLIAFKRGRAVQLFSRNRLSQNDAYPTIVRAVRALPVRDAILDGEALGVWGASSGRGVAYRIFDLVWLNGSDLRNRALDDRRAALDALSLDPPLYRVATLAGPKPWEHACAGGWEGVIAKRRQSRYESRRSPHWLKMKCEASQELVIGGFTDPQGGRVGLGAILVGYFDGDDFVFAGKVGTGFTTRMLRDLRARLDAIEIGRSPFTRATALPRLRAHWVRPEVVVQVGFIEWTVHDKLRHPRLLGIRVDKSAREVVRESG